MNRTCRTSVSLLLLCATLLHAAPDATNAPVAVRAADAPATTAAEPDTFNFRIFAYLASFHWEERFDGVEVVDEHGPLIGIGFAFDRRLVTESLPLILLGSGDSFIGEMDYDGGLQAEDGTVTPFRSDTTYAGLRGQLALGSPVALGESVTLTPFGGLGARGWVRTLDTEIGDDDIGTHGYEEFWGTAYGVFGAQLDLAFSARNRLHASAQANLPFWNGMIVDLSNVGGPDDADLDPEKETGWQAELGYITGNLSLALFYEAQNFGQSDVSEEGFFQPDSEARIAGGRISYDL